MKYWIIGGVVGLLLGIGVIAWCLCNNNQMAYINTSVLMEKSIAIQNVKKDMQKDVDQAKANLDTLQSEFENELKKYEKESSGMSNKEREMAKQLLNVKRQEMSRYQQAMENTLSKQEQKMTADALKAINDYITQYGKEHHYKIIFATISGNIAYADESIDITDRIIEGVNKNVK